jgi:hypothetical protein
VKGAQTRSCSWAVLVEDPTKEVAGVGRPFLILLEAGEPGWRVWRLQSQRPVGTVAVGMLDVDPKDLLEWPRPTIGSPSRHSARTVAPSVRRTRWLWVPAPASPAPRQSLRGTSR